MRFLVKDWKELSLKSYTAWAFYTLALITVLPDLIYVFFQVDTNPQVWSFLQITTIILGLIGRMVLQPNANKWRRRIICAVMAIVILGVSLPAMAKPYPYPESQAKTEAFELISKWEGKKNTAYLDIVNVPTICYGHTRTVTRQMVFDRVTWTDEFCKDLLLEEIVEYRDGVQRYFTIETKKERLTPKRDAAYTSLGFNIGYDRAGKSTATKRLNKGNIKGGCEAIGWWNKAGGRVVRGIVNRRNDEVLYCLDTSPFEVINHAYYDYNMDYCPLLEEY